MLTSNKSPVQPILKARTFASVVSTPIEDVHLSQLPTLVMHGDKTYVKINEDLYQEQLKLFQNNLLGRLLLNKGYTPMKTGALKSCLEDAWHPTTPWNLVPIGKGYFDIHFNKEDDMRWVWGGGTCTLATGLFRLSKWTPDFQPGDIFPQTHAQVLIKIFGLSQEYWHSKHLMEIERGVNAPLHLDIGTREMQYGYYARILVDVNLADDLPTSLMVERESHGFPVETRKGGNMGDNKIEHHSQSQLHMEYHPKKDLAIPVNVLCGSHASEPLQQVDQLLPAINTEGNEAMVDGNDEPILQSPLGTMPIVSSNDNNVILTLDNAHTLINQVLEHVVDEALRTIAQVMVNSENEKHGIQSPGISHISNFMTGSLSTNGSPYQNGHSYGQHLGNTDVPNNFGPHDLHDDFSILPGIEHVVTLPKDVIDIVNHINGCDKDGFTPALSNSKKKNNKSRGTLAPNLWLLTSLTCAYHLVISISDQQLLHGLMVRGFAVAQKEGIDEVCEVIQPMVTDSENDLLSALPIDEENKEAIFSLSASSTPKPDGFPGAY
ncbi:unnamed protein product [Malus baccata var. baccata]